MTENTGTVRRRTVLSRAAAGFGGVFALGATDPVGESAAAVCVQAVGTADAWLDACPNTADAHDIPDDEYGTAYKECWHDGEYWLRVDWDNYPDLWVPESDITYC